MNDKKQFVKDLQKTANKYAFDCGFILFGNYILINGSVEEVRATMREYEKYNFHPTRVFKTDHPTDDWHGQGCA